MNSKNKGEKMAGSISKEQENTQPESPAGIKIRNEDLLMVFRGVLEKWTSMDRQSLCLLVERPFPELGLERMVGFSGMVEGCLVVRAQAEFGRTFWKRVLGNEKRINTPTAEEAFGEFVNLYFGHLLSGLRYSLDGPLEAFLPQPSHSRLWPRREPDAALTLLVETLPVEIRFWMGPA